MFNIYLISAPGSESLQMDHNPPKDVPQESVPINLFMRVLQDTLVFTPAQVRILAEDRYVTQDMVLY